MSNTKIRLPVLVAAILSIGLSAVPSLGDERETFERTLPFNPGGEFRVENVNGSITIETWNESSVRIEAEKVANSTEDLRKIEIVVRGEGDRVEVTTRFPRNLFGRGNRHVDYHIYLPVEATVDAETVNGQVDIEGIHGRVEASSVNGGIQVYDVAGEMDVSTTNGSIKARYEEATDGRHRFSTTNGSVTVTLPDGAGR